MKKTLFSAVLSGLLLISSVQAFAASFTYTTPAFALSDVIVEENSTEIVTHIWDGEQPDYASFFKTTGTSPNFAKQTVNGRDDIMLYSANGTYTTRAVIGYSRPNTASYPDRWHPNDTFGLTNENFIDATLTMDIKVNNITALDSLSVIFGNWYTGETDKTLTEQTSDTHVGNTTTAGIDRMEDNARTLLSAYLTKNEEGSYVSKDENGNAVTATELAADTWYSVNIPLSVYANQTKMKTCGCTIDWSKINLLEFRAEKNTGGFYVKEIKITRPAGRTVEVLGGDLSDSHNTALADRSFLTATNNNADLSLTSMTEDDAAGGNKAGDVVVTCTSGTTDSALRVAAGFAKNGRGNTDVTFGLNEENYKTATLTMDVKTTLAAEFQYLDFSLACMTDTKAVTTNASHSKGTDGMERCATSSRLKLSQYLPDNTTVADDTWVTVTIPLSDFASVAMECGCEPIPWERFNLIELRMPKYGSSTPVSNGSYAFKNPVIHMPLAECSVNYGFSDGDNDFVDDALAAGNVLTPRADIMNETNENQKYTIIFAVYKNGDLAEVQLAQKTVLPGNSMDAAADMNTYTVPDDGANYTAKMFCWSGLDTLKACGEVYVNTTAAAE